MNWLDLVVTSLVDILNTHLSGRSPGALNEAQLALVSTAATAARAGEREAIAAESYILTEMVDVAFASDTFPIARVGLVAVIDKT